MLLIPGQRAGSRIDRWRHCGALLATTAALMLLPIGAGDAGWLPEMFNASSSHGKPTKHLSSRKHAASVKRAALPKPHTFKLAALGPALLSPDALKPAGCDRPRFRIVVDVGHTAQSEGAISARNVAEFAFNLRLAQRIEEKLKANGFGQTKLLVTDGRARPSLFKRVAAANDLGANLFLSIHHDSVPDNLLESWEFEGKKSHFSDRFSGYSVWVSHENADFRTSLLFAELLGKQMKAQGLEYAHQYTDPIMGRYRHPLLNRETGVYSHDELVVLRKTRMPAVLLEAGSISNRDEELVMSSPERQNIVAAAVTAAVEQFCTPARFLVPTAAPPAASAPDAEKASIPASPPL